VLHSALMPRVIGVLLMLGGVAWLTYVDLSLARSLQPYNMACGIIAEFIFTLGLIAAGVRRDTRISGASASADREHRQEQSAGGDVLDRVFNRT
jgi:hypothetical protein